MSISGEAAALLDIRVSPVVQAPAEVNVKMFGKIDFDERSTVTTAARMSGRLDRLYADFTGTRVSKGDAIAEIYSPELIIAQHTLIRARIDWLNAKTSNDRASRLQMLKYARQKMRLLNLSEEQVTTIEKQKKPSDHITLLAPQSGIIVNLNVKEGQYVKTGDTLFSIAKLDSVWLKIEAFESDLPWLRYAQDVTFNVDAIPEKVFHGPIAFIDPQLDPIRRIIKVRVNVKNDDLQLKPGMFANASVHAKVALDGHVLSADLAGKWISPMHPEIVKDSPGSCDICGMPLIKAEDYGFVAPDGPVVNPLLIPVSAVLRTADRAVVYVRLPEKIEPVFEGREIVLGPRAGNFFIIRSGLGVGELVVTKGAYKLDSELQIKAHPSMMNPNAGLEERSAKDAPSQISGQWPQLLRTYGKLAPALASGDHATAASELTKMQNGLSNIKHDQLQPKELALWKEFSMRLSNVLTEVSTMPANASTLALIRHQMVETRRFVGLSATPIAPADIDASWIAPLKESNKFYLGVAEALSEDKFEHSMHSVSSLESAVTALPESSEKAAIQKALKHVSMQKDIDGLRSAFKPLSVAMIAAVRKHGIDQLGELYIVHCPMADDNKGADWLSNKNEVRNPYFGSSMFGCGDVTDTLSQSIK